MLSLYYDICERISMTIFLLETGYLYSRVKLRDEVNYNEFHPVSVVNCNTNDNKMLSWANPNEVAIKEIYVEVVFYIFEKYELQ